MTIAILGCTGQIGRTLTRGLSAGHELALYSRRPDWMRQWLTGNALDARVLEIQSFPSGRFDLIVNAIGDGAPGRIRAAAGGIVETTARFDEMCLDYLNRNSSCAYIFLSTGRVYGPNYEHAQKPDASPLEPDRFTREEFYPFAKRQAELRHRGLPHRRIADIRIFGYVSDEIDLQDDFLVSQMLRALVGGETFVTTPGDIERDYIGPDDLVSLIERLFDAGVPNGAFDIYSARPTTKFEMLQALARDFGLRFRFDGARNPILRHDRISLQTAAQAIGYIPRHTSLENVLAAAAAVRRCPRKTDRNSLS